MGLATYRDPPGGGSRTGSGVHHPDHKPGKEAEVDFGEMWVKVAGVRTKCQLFTFRLSFSGKAVHRVFASGGRCQGVSRQRVTCLVEFERRATRTRGVPIVRRVRAEYPL